MDSRRQVNLATTPTMENETPAPTKKSQAELLASVLRRCMAGIVASRAQTEASLQRLHEVEATLEKLAAMANNGGRQ